MRIVEGTYFAIKYSIVLTILLSAVSCSYKITPADKNSIIKDELFYTLPKNTLVLDLVLEKKIATRGSKFIGNSTSKDLEYLSDIIDITFYKKFAADNSVKKINRYKIKDVKVSVGSIPDLSKVYKIDNIKRFLKNQNITLTISENNTVGGIDYSSEFIGDDILLGLASAITSARGPGYDDDYSDYVKTIHSIVDKKIDFYDSSSRLSSDVLFTESIKHFDKKIFNLLKKYFYTIKSVEEKIRIEYVPKNESANNEPMFAFDGSKGEFHVLKTNLCEISSGKTSIKVQKVDMLDSKLKNTYSLSLEKSDDQILEMINQSNKDDEGFRYNVPALMNVYITKGEKETIYSGKSKLAQFGKIAALQKSSNASLVFNSNTGEITKVTSGSKTETSSILSSLSAVSSSLIDTELEALQKESQILELKEKIKNLKENSNKE